MDIWGGYKQSKTFLFYLHLFMKKTVGYLYCIRLPPITQESNENGSLTLAKVGITKSENFEPVLNRFYQIKRAANKSGLGDANLPILTNITNPVTPTKGIRLIIDTRQHTGSSGQRRHQYSKL